MKLSKKSFFKVLLPVIGTAMLFGAASVSAEEAAAEAAIKSDSPHKLVIQVSTDDERTQKIALNNAVNLQKIYGMDNVAIEIVAYGPGLGMLTKKSKEAGRVKSLALQNITFSACGNTMAAVEKKSGKKPQLVEGVGVVKAGVARILALQEGGYAYVRP